MGFSDRPETKAHLHAGYQFTPWLFTMQSTTAQDLHMGHLLFTYSQTQSSCALQRAVESAFGLVSPSYHPLNVICDERLLMHYELCQDYIFFYNI